MQKNLFLWRLSRIYVWLFPFTAALVLALRFGVPVAYSVVAIDLVLLGGAVWVLVAKVAKTGTPQQRTVLTAGVLLVAIVGIISLIFPLGPPPRDPAGYLATRVEQEFRYTILMIAALVAFGGFTILAGMLREAGDRIFSLLGLAAIILSTVLFVVSSPLVYVNVEMLQQKISSGKTPDWYNLTRIYFQPLFVLGGLLTYAATAAYAAALGWVGWFEKLSSRLLAGTSVAAAVLVSVSPLGGKIGAPGFILLIPALPYLMPYFIGVLLVTRAGRLALGPETAGENNPTSICVVDPRPHASGNLRTAERNRAEEPDKSETHMSGQIRDLMRRSLPFPAWPAGPSCGWLAHQHPKRYPLRQEGRP